MNTVKPEVGMGMTEYLYSDQHAYTVVELVSDSTIRVQRDKATRTDSNGMSDCQSYKYEPNSEGGIATLTLRRTKRHPEGVWARKGESVKKGGRWTLNRREEYHDYSF